LEEKRRLLDLCDAIGVEPDDELDRLVSGEKPFAPQTRRYAALQPELRELVLNDTLDLKTAERWQVFPAAAKTAHEAAGELARFSFSNRRQLFTMLWQIAQRDGLSDGQLADLLRALLSTSDPVAEARRQRFPALRGLESRFEDIASRTLGGSGVRLSPPPYFEGSRFTVEFSFESRAELERRLGALSRLGEDVDELFELL
jgi:hypothetical protein